VAEGVPSCEGVGPAGGSAAAVGLLLLLLVCRWPGSLACTAFITKEHTGSVTSCWLIAATPAAEAAVCAGVAAAVGRHGGLCRWLGEVEEGVSEGVPSNGMKPSARPPKPNMTGRMCAGSLVNCVTACKHR
jgi:hypothetical protein